MDYFSVDSDLYSRKTIHRGKITDCLAKSSTFSDDVRVLFGTSKIGYCQ